MTPSTQLAILLTAACLCVCAAAPDARLGRKSQRPTRGFKNVEMMTARGFGKRDHPPDSITRAEQLEGYSTPIRRTFNPKTSLMVANGFGKRADEVVGEDNEVRVTRGWFKPNAKILIARGYGKRNLESDEVYGLDSLWEKLENGNTAEREGQDGEEKMESIPTDWFVNEVLNNPDFARSVVRKFIDLDQDGMLSTQELLRNVV